MGIIIYGTCKIFEMTIIISWIISFSPFSLFDSLLSLISLLVLSCVLDFTKVLMRCWSLEKLFYCNSFYGVNLQWCTSVITFLFSYTFFFLFLFLHVYHHFLFRNFVIVTGDSLGNTQFWDGKHGTLLQVNKTPGVSPNTFSILPAIQ